MEKKYKLYILLTDTGTVLNRLIKWYTHDPFNHVSIAFDEELKDVYSFGRKKENNPIIGGFVKENIEGIILSNAKCAVYEMTDIDPYSYFKIRDYIKNFENNRDRYRYNLIGLIGVALNIPIERGNAFFCSQFVASVFEYAGAPIIDKPSNVVTPGDFQSSPKLQCIYDGDLKNYRKTLLRKQFQEEEKSAKTVETSLSVQV